VRVKVRVASDVRDANGFIFDNSLLSNVGAALQQAPISTSCEDLAIFFAYTIHAKSAVPLKWISVAVESDFEGAIGFTWRDGDCMPRARLYKLGTAQEAKAAYEIKRQLEADMHIFSCGGHK
jgi:1,4-dihydroxy-2-naphthoyl-CoA synthase